MNHPTIPTNSPFFSGNMFVISAKPSPTGAAFVSQGPISDLTDYLRPIVACIARCAWLDEVAKLHDSIDFDLAETICLYESNAEAWRIWGLGENEEKVNA